MTKPFSATVMTTAPATVIAAPAGAAANDTLEDTASSQPLNIFDNEIVIAV